METPHDLNCRLHWHEELIVSTSVFVYSCLPVFMLDYLRKMKQQMELQKTP